MRAIQLSKIVLAGAIVALVGVMQAVADEPYQPNMQTGQPIQAGQQNMQGGQQGFNAVAQNEIVGQNVENAKGEKLGSVEYLIINLNSGKVDYAGLSVSGVSNYVAVPFSDIRVTKEQNNKAKLALDITKDRLKQAPTFEKDKWSEFDNAQWRSQVDTFYRQASTGRPTQR